MGQAWFLSFWGFFFLLGFLEYMFSGAGPNAARSNRWPTNVGLGLINGAVFSVLPTSIIWVADWAAANGFGLLHIVSAPIWPIVVVTILVKSAGQYFFHRILHKIPLLWRIHQVHHCDTWIDGSTALRFHPFELLANIAFVVPLVLLVGLDPATIAAFEIIDVIVGIFSHTCLRLPEAIDSRLRLLFVTPGMHRLHHSDYQPETDSNFGATFSFWDRIFGTYLDGSVRQADKFRLGLEGIRQKQASDFLWLLLLPLKIGQK